MLLSNPLLLCVLRADLELRAAIYQLSDVRFAVALLLAINGPTFIALD